MGWILRPVSRAPVPLACRRCGWRSCGVKYGVRRGGAGGEAQAVRGGGEVRVPGATGWVRRAARPSRAVDD